MKTFEKIIVVVSVVLFVGMVILAYVIFRLNSDINAIKFQGTSEVSERFVLPSASQSAGLDVLQVQVAELQASSEALLVRVEVLEGTEPTKTVVVSSKQTFKTEQIFIGSASTQERDWVSTGVVVTLNSADYPANVNAIFEAGLAIVSGEVSARLINKTTGAIMTITEISASSSMTTWRTSPKFKLFSGSNVYELQMKSSSGEVANVSSARIILSK